MNGNPSHQHQLPLRTPFTRRNRLLTFSASWSENAQFPRNLRSPTRLISVRAAHSLVLQHHTLVPTIPTRYGASSRTPRARIGEQASSLSCIHYQQEPLEATEPYRSQASSTALLYDRTTADAPFTVSTRLTRENLLLSLPQAARPPSLLNLLKTSTDGKRRTVY